MNILLVVDMQNDFVSGSLGTEQAAAVVPFVEKRIRESTDDLILFTQDTHDDDYLETQEGQRLPVEHCMRGTKGWEIEESLLKAFEENTYTRRLEGLENNSLIKYAFGSRELIELLEEVAQEEPIQRVEIMGLCTDICVISNAMLLKAYFPETLVEVNAGGCAGVTPESHQTALDALIACQVDII